MSNYKVYTNKKNWKDLQKVVIQSTVNTAL